MDHYHLDKYAKENYFYQKLNPIVKIITSIILMIFIVITPSSKYFLFPAYFLLIIIVALLSKVPLLFLFRKSLLFLPFVATILIFSLFSPINGQTQRWLITSVLFFKSWLTFTITVLLVSTTEFNSLLKGFEKLKTPKIITLLLSFIYRYFFIFIDEFQRMIRAAQSRSGKNHLNLKSVGNAIGTLFIRAYEKSELIYKAMLSRGFSGEIKTHKEFALNNIDKGYFLLTTGIFLILLMLII